MSEATKQPVLQAELLQSVPSITELLNRYELPTERFLNLTEEAKSFTVRMPLVGAFSSGKTSLINAVLGKKYFAVEVNAETSLPMELRYGEQPSFTGYKNDGATFNYTCEQVLQQDFADILPAGWLQAELPSELLSRFKSLTLVDMPGWESGIEQHSIAIDKYLSRSLAYAIVVSAEEGSLRSSLRVFIDELARRKMPALLIVTKADKKPAEDIDTVVAKLTTEVSDLLGQAPLAVAVVSARKNNIDSFVSALVSLDAKVDERFYQAVITPVREQLNQLAHRLEQLSNEDNLDVEQIQAQREELEQEAIQFRQRREHQDIELDQSLKQGVERVLQHVKSQLLSNSNSFADDLAHGSSLEGNMMTAVRLALAESVESEFSTKVHHYLSSIANDVPQGINVSANLKATDGFKISEETSSNFNTTLIGMLPTLIPQVGLPGKVLSVVGSLLIDAARSFFNNTNKKLEAARQQEAAQEQIINQCIPAVMRQVETQLRLQIQQQAMVIKAKVATETDAEIARNQTTLQELAQQLQQGAAAFAKQRECYLQDLQSVQQLLTTFTDKELC